MDEIINRYSLARELAIQGAPQPEVLKALVDSWKDIPELVKIIQQLRG